MPDCLHGLITVKCRNIVKLNKPPAHIVFFVHLLLVFSSGCSVQKNTGMSRAFHNLTARFNVLFNGKESFKKGTDKIDKDFKDDYTEILPVFPFVEKSASQLASSDMDRTIKKCGKLISMHSITAKPKVKNSKTLTPKEREFFNKKEYNAFVDDAYLLMGKAHFYKQEHTEASEIFHLILNDFKNQSVIPETQVWFARLLIETGQNKDAYEIINLLLNNPEFPKNCSLIFIRLQHIIILNKRIMFRLFLSWKRLCPWKGIKKYVHAIYIFWHSCQKRKGT